MNPRLDLSSSFLVASDVLRRTLFSKNRGRVFLVVENCASRRFLHLNISRASKGPSSVISNIRTMLIRARIRHNVVTASELNCFSLESRYSRIVSRKPLNSDTFFVPSWTSSVGELFRIIDWNSSAKYLLGPNLKFLLGQDGILSHEVCQLIDSKSYTNIDVIFPTEKIGQLFSESKEICNSRHSFVRILPTSIDEKYWKPARLKRSLNKILIYIKGNLTESDHKLINEIQRRYKDKCLILQYGRYTQAEYRKMLRRVKVAIFFSGTESQGLALLEAWSCNVITLVRIPLERPGGSLNEQVYGQEFMDYAPYLSDKTGEFFMERTELFMLLESIEHSQMKFNPRLWTVTNFGMKQFKDRTFSS